MRTITEIGCTPSRAELEWLIHSRAEYNGSGSVTGSHVYATDGVFTISLTVTDKDGGAGSSIFQYEVIYNASAKMPMPSLQELCLDVG